MSRKYSLAVVACLALSACATTGHTSSLGLHVNSKSASLGGVQLGESDAVVLERVAVRFEQAPQCESRKVALNKTRKAFAYQVCKLNPSNQSWLKAPVSEIVYHFVESELIKIDMTLQADESLLPKFEHEISHSMGAGKKVAAAQNSDAVKVKTQWQAEPMVASLRAGKAAASGHVFVQLYDNKVLANAPWLTDAN